jgi:hypothetical protein
LSASSTGSRSRTEIVTGTSTFLTVPIPTVPGATARRRSTAALFQDVREVAVGFLVLNVELVIIGK